MEVPTKTRVTRGHNRGGTGTALGTTLGPTPTPMCDECRASFVLGDPSRVRADLTHGGLVVRFTFTFTFSCPRLCERATSGRAATVRVCREERAAARAQSVRGQFVSSRPDGRDAVLRAYDVHRDRVGTRVHAPSRVPGPVSSPRFGSQIDTRPSARLRADARLVSF